MNITKKLRLIPWWVWIVAVDLVLVFITIIKHNLPDSLWGIYHHFDLGREMNMAAWWSGICLVALAFLAYELYSTNKDRTRVAWLILSLILFGLSLDEIGSLHERVESWKIIIWSY